MPADESCEENNHQKSEIAFIMLVQELLFVYDCCNDANNLIQRGQSA